MPEITHLSDLTPDPQNARRHNARNLGQIVDALHRVGAARSIVIDETGMVLAGNGVVEAAAEAGIERVRVVDADGEELIAVRRRGMEHVRNVAEQLSVPLLVARDLCEGEGTRDLAPALSEFHRLPAELVAWPIAATVRHKIGEVYRRRCMARRSPTESA